MLGQKEIKPLPMAVLKTNGSRVLFSEATAFADRVVVGRKPSSDLCGAELGRRFASLRTERGA
jgi:hypothetical protein